MVVVIMARHQSVEVPCLALPGIVRGKGLGIKQQGTSPLLMLPVAETGLQRWDGPRLAPSVVLLRAKVGVVGRWALGKKGLCTKTP